MKLANVTMHDQTQYIEQFRQLGYEIDPRPLLKEVSGAQEAYQTAKEAIQEAIDMGAEGILLGGRTDLCIYAAILAAQAGLRVLIAETKRIRDENDRFVFVLAGVTPVYLDIVPAESSIGVFPLSAVVIDSEAIQKGER